MVVPAGTTLFRLGDPAGRLFLVERGRIKLTLPMSVRGQEENVLWRESARSGCGWSALIPPYRFTLTATAALHDAEVIALPREALVGFSRPTRRQGTK